MDRYVGWIIGLCLLTFFTNLGGAKLWDRDEPRNARCAVEMRERGDFVVPTFNGELRAHKPILLYWLMLTAYSVFGENEFAARFWSALLSLGTVLLTYHLGRRMFDRQAALWGAIALATSLMFNVAARAATPDAVLIFCCTLAFTCLWRAHEAHAAESRRPSRRYEHFAFAAMGLAVLAKGPVGVVLPVVAWAGFQWWQSGATLSQRAQLPSLISVVRQLRPMSLLVIVLAIAAPWYILVGVRTDGRWLHEFFVVHNLERATNAMEGHQGNPLLFYPAALLAGFFPWSIFAIPGAIWTYHRCRENIPAYSFLFCWILAFLGAISFASTKLPNYVTPIYPALALITGHFLTQWSKAINLGTAACWMSANRLRTFPPRTPLGRQKFRNPAINWTIWSATSLILVGVAMTIGFGWALSTLLPNHDSANDGGISDIWLSCVGLIPLVGGSVALTYFRRTEWQFALRTLGATALLFAVTLFGVIGPRISRHQEFTTLLPKEMSDKSIASLAVHEPSWIFYAERTIPFYSVDHLHEAADYLQTEAAHLITSERYLNEVRDVLPRELDVVARVPYFLKDDHLLLIKRR